ncbi:MAG: ATP-binding protein [Actinomycetales bacterium]
MTVGTGSDPSESARYLIGRLAQVEQRVRTLVDSRRAEDPSAEDPFRGLYVSEELVVRLLSGRATTAAELTPDPEVEAAADAAQECGLEIRLRSLARAAALSELDVNILLVALIPDLDARFERLYGYLNDDVSRRRATVGLALELLGYSAMSAAARARFTASEPLRRNGLLRIEDEDRPFLTRGLRVPDTVAAHLLGDHRPHPDLLDLRVPTVPYPCPLADQLAVVLGGDHPVVHLRESDQATGMSVAAAALADAGHDWLTLDLLRLAEAPDPARLVEVAVREVLLTGSGIIAGPVEALAMTHPPAVRRLTDGSTRVLLTGRSSWDPRWSARPPLSVDTVSLDAGEHAAVWREHLGDSELPLADLTGHLTLGPGQVPLAVAAARRSAAAAGRAVSADDLRRGVRTQNASGLERLARRIEPGVDWDDLVLAPTVARALHALTARARHRHTVLSSWRMRRGGGRGRGITALFGGDSGTGKTMSAEVIAGDLGLDLYTVNLATVIDKYVGETEKNLERIFVEASGINAVLFFDEADAIFGKRAEVRDAHDRYANIESAYLLQRLETFDGLAVLATNLRTNIDEAFTRRLDAIIDFPSPTAQLRRRLWEVTLSGPLPVADDVDLGFLSESFDLAGGNIRSAATTAAYLAAAKDQPVSMVDLVMAVEQEYRKLGRLVLEGEFGRFLELLG